MPGYPGQRYQVESLVLVCLPGGWACFIPWSCQPVSWDWSCAPILLVPQWTEGLNESHLPRAPCYVDPVLLSGPFPVTPQPLPCNWAESVTLGSDLCLLLLITSGSPFSLISSFFALHSYSFLQSPSNHLPNSLLDTNSDSRVFVTFLVSALESHGSKRRRKRQIACHPNGKAYLLWPRLPTEMWFEG